MQWMGGAVWTFFRLHVNKVQVAHFVAVVEKIIGNRNLRNKKRRRWHRIWKVLPNRLGERNLCMYSYFLDNCRYLLNLLGIISYLYV